MRWSIVAFLTTLMFVCGAPARGQTPSPDALAAAREVMVASKATDQMKAMLPNIMQALKPAIAQGRPAVEKEYDALVPLMLNETYRRLDEMIDAVAAVYVQHFTVAELRQISAFYRTPVGQKVLEKLPTVMQESMVVGQKFGQAIAADLQKRMSEELRKRGHNI